MVQIEPETDSDLHGIHACVDQGPCPLRGRDVAGDQVKVRKRLPQSLRRIDHVLRVAMGAVQHQDVSMRGSQRLGPLDGVLTDTDRRADPQAAEQVLARLRILDRLLDVLDGYQSAQVEVAVDDEEFLDAVPMQDLLGLGQRRADWHGNEVLARHHLRNR